MIGEPLPSGLFGITAVCDPCKKNEGTGDRDPGMESLLVQEGNSQLENLSPVTYSINNKRNGPDVSVREEGALWSG